MCECADLGCTESVLIRWFEYGSVLRQRSAVRRHRARMCSQTWSASSPSPTAMWWWRNSGRRRSSCRGDGAGAGLTIRGEGMPCGMEGRREWVEHLLEACDRALARLEERDDADLESVADLEELRARLENSRTAGRRSSAAALRSSGRRNGSGEARVVTVAAVWAQPHRLPEISAHHPPLERLTSGEVGF